MSDNNQVAKVEIIERHIFRQMSYRIYACKSFTKNKIFNYSSEENYNSFLIEILFVSLPYEVPDYMLIRFDMTTQFRPISKKSVETK